MGIVREPIESYLEADALSASALKHMLRSPQHFVHYRETPQDEPTKAMRFGTIAHCAIIEPRRFLDNFIVRPKFDRRTKIGKEGAEEFDASIGPDAIVLEQDDADHIVGMINSVKCHPAASKLLQGGIPEQSIYFDILGVSAKTRPDYINVDQKAVIDLKTCMDASYKEFQRQVTDYEYSIQAAMQADGCEQVLGWKDHIHVWIAIEKTPPYAVAVYASDDTVLGMGRQDYNRAVGRYKACMENSRWPGYGDDVMGMALPPWRIGDLE